jgi:hypothetical protein
MRMRLKHFNEGPREPHLRVTVTLSHRPASAIRSRHALIVCVTASSSGAFFTGSA